jgi:hypothetical protein
MSSTTTEYTRAAQEKTLEAIRQSQDAIVESVRSWAEAAGKATPNLPEVPYAKELPSAEEIIESSFDFASQLLDAQREFTKNLVAATAPAAPTSKS